MSSVYIEENELALHQVRNYRKIHWGIKFLSFLTFYLGFIDQACDIQ